MKLVTLEDKLASETKRIVRNARTLHKRSHLKKPMYLSRNGLVKEIDVINSSLVTIDSYIENHKTKGRFYMIGVKDINPRRLVIPPLADFIYSTFFYRGLSSLGNVKFKKEIYKILGVGIGENVNIYQGAKLDLLFPRLTEIGDNTTIGGESVFYNHSNVASKDYFGWGRIKIGKNCNIGNSSMISPMIIGDNSSLMPGTMAAGYLAHIPENTVYGGNPPRRIKTIG